MQGVSTKVQKAIFGIYGAFMLGILMLVLFLDKWVDYLCQGTSLLPNLLLLPIALSLIALYLAYGKKLPAHSTIKSLLILAAILLVVQVFVAYNIYFLTGWDAGIVNHGSNALHRGELLDVLYFQKYPNNIFLLAVFTFLKNISGGSYLFIMVVGIGLVNASVLLTALCTYELTQSQRLTYVSFGLGALIFGLSPWMVIPYSDVFAILFPVLTVYLYLRSKSWSPFLRTLVIVGVPAIGSLIKPQCIIVLIAIIMCELLRTEKVRLSMGKAVKAAVALVIVGTIVGLLPIAARAYTGIPNNEDVEIGSSHFIMLGLNSERNGIYSIEDLAYTDSFTGKDAKQANNFGESKRRIKAMGFGGMVKHLSKKTLVNFNDGTFGWGMEGDFYSQTYSTKIPIISSALRSLYYNEGRLYPILATFCQLMWLLVLVLCAIALLWRGRTQVIHISLLGIICFSTMFEARSRYLFAYAPLFVIAAMLGLMYVENTLLPHVILKAKATRAKD